MDLVSQVIRPLIGVISIVTLTITLATKSHDHLSQHPAAHNPEFQALSRLESPRKRSKPSYKPF